ncbi:MAG: Peptidoglycan O-acetyltransferase [Bacteroidetes bacterium ADurb.Bin408]|nr:MAG: Peptidoglycan O-acetyltransferase [Bacteroidetes bacterium ADurb.Bin408]
MAYNSVVFIFLFLPVFLGVYYMLPGIKAKNTALFVFSLFFYFWGAAWLVALLPLTGLAAWFFSWLIVKTKFKRVFLTTAILFFAGLLVYNKYLVFFIGTLMQLGMTGLHEVKTVSILGASFFTFQAISYNMDVYRKEKRFEKNPLYVILYIAMFPQLLSGPLVRYHQMSLQMRERTTDWLLFAEGVRRFVKGLGKKVLIADSLSFVVAQIVDNDQLVITPAVAWVCMVVFAIQIFFDFSGYTDMAIGVGKMLGFELPENFNYPYISTSITEFWRRWHITFATWIKEYIFTPLAIATRDIGKAGIFLSILITFIICGLWHGPTWNFVAWGFVQGLFLGMEELFLLKYLKRLKQFSVLYVLFLIVTCLVLFRTPDFAHAYRYYAFMFSPAAEGAHGLTAFFTTEHYVLLLAGIVLCVPFKWPEKLKIKDTRGIIPVVGDAAVIVVFLLSVMRLVTETFNPFIYFKF